MALLVKIKDIREWLLHSIYIFLPDSVRAGRWNHCADVIQCPVILWGSGQSANGYQPQVTRLCLNGLVLFILVTCTLKIYILFVPSSVNANHQLNSYPMIWDNWLLIMASLFDYGNRNRSQLKLITMWASNQKLLITLNLTGKVPFAIS